MDFLFKRSKRDLFSALFNDVIFIHASTTTMTEIEAWPRSFHVVRITRSKVNAEKIFSNDDGANGIIELMKFLKHAPAAILVLWKSTERFGISYWLELARLHGKNVTEIDNLQIDLKDVIENEFPKMCSCKIKMIPVFTINGLASDKILAGEDEPREQLPRVNESTAAKVQGMIALMLKLKNKTFVFEDPCLRHSS